MKRGEKKEGNNEKKSKYFTRFERLKYDAIKIKKFFTSILYNII